MEEYSRVAGRKIGILGTGAYVPQRVLTNKDLERLVNTNNNWILERTGIAERRIAAPDETNVTMAVAAARRALAAADLAPEDLSYIILATNTPTHYFPAGAIQIQEELGVNGVVAAFDVQAGCTGFNYALYVAERMVAPEGNAPWSSARTPTPGSPTGRTAPPACSSGTGRGPRWWGRWSGAAFWPPLSGPAST